MHTIARMLAPALVVACWLAAPAHAADPQTSTVRTYLVTDLIIPTPDMGCDQPEHCGRPVKTLEAQLIKTLVETIAPASWLQNGGKGVVAYCPLTNSLVVHQTPEIHQQIAEVLEALRRLKDVQVALEVRIVSAADSLCERGGVAAADVKGTCFLNDKQARSLLEAVQGDRHSNVLMAPKMTLCNGQAGTLRIGEPGLRMCARPIVSADRRFVKVALDLECCDKAGGAAAVKIDRTVAVPDGGTVLFCGEKLPAGCPGECGVPVLNKIPHLQHLFQPAACQAAGRKVFVMVTPRVVVAEEEEAKVLPPARACCMEPAAVKATAVKVMPEPARPCCPFAAATVRVSAVKTTPEPSRQQKVIAELLAAYESACAEGRDAEARKYAEAALSIDPGCFRRGH